MLNVRGDFPILKKKVQGKSLLYLDTAATAHKPQSVIDTISHFYAEEYGTVHRAVYDLAQHATEQHQKVREQVRCFIGAKKREEIIFTRGTTESINLVASSFGKAFIKPNDEILISEMEHHSNIVPWQMVCEEKGAQLKIIPVQDNGEIDLVAYQALLSKKTRIVSVCHVSNVLGTINPIQEMAVLAHQAGAYFLVDGAQSVPHMSINVQQLDCDFYVFSGHKLYGPTGIGVLYGKEELLEKMPPYQGGGDMIQKVTFEKTSYNALPLKFEAGTPMIAQVMGLGAAIQYIERVGLEDINEWEGKLLKKLEEKIQRILGIQIIGNANQKGAIVSFIVDGVDPLDLGMFLNFEGIAIRTGHHCAQPLMNRFGVNSIARASFGLYNTLEEIDHFTASLEKVVERLRAY